MEMVARRMLSPSGATFSVLSSSAHVPRRLNLGNRIRRRASAKDEDNESKGQQLWRKELQSTSEESFPGLFDEQTLESSAIQADIQRLAKQQEVDRLLKQPSGGGAKTQEQQSGGFSAVVEKVLVADFFFILGILAWLVAGVAEVQLVQSSKLIDSWLPLWSPVFQPALGVFMAGALWTAVAKRRTGQ